MKNIILAFVVSVVFLPQMSFGDIDPQLAAFNQQEDAQAAAFFQQQSDDRGVFMKAHTDIVAREEKRFKDWLDKRDEDRHQALLSGNKNPPDSGSPPRVQDATMGAFVAKQLSDKNAFLAKLAEDRKQFLSSHPGITP